MLKTHYCLLFLLTILISCSGQIKEKDYSDDKGKFKIQFKRKPVIKTETQQFPFANVAWTITSVDQADENNLSYLVKYADFPAATITSDSLRLLHEFFLFTQSDLVQRLDEAGLHNMNIKQLQKYPGREFRWIDKPNNLGYTRRTYLVKNRLYFLEVKYHLENDFNNDIEGFFDGFGLLKTIDNPNPEIIAEKPVKKFDASFPGATIIRDNPTVHELFGNIYAMAQLYETPKDQMDLPATKNIMYGVNYARLPGDKLKAMTTAQVREFVTKAFTDNIQKQTNGRILMQKEINIEGNWGIEAQGTIANNMAVMHLRAFVAEDYYYQIIVISKNGTQNNKEALDFLNSFRLRKD